MDSLSPDSISLFRTWKGGLTVSFVYPEFIEKNEVYAEDVEEAIIQYLMKGGRTRSDLENMRFEFECPTTGKMVTTKVLTIKLT
jgi:hypothetical protein